MSDAASRAARALALLDRVLALPAAARAALLDRECADDAPLRAEVEAMLAVENASEHFLQPLIESAPSRAGERVDAYRLVREIGAGGMGSVFLAERADALYDQRVAVKFLRFDLSNFRQRFDNERRILAALDHPNIAKLIDAGQDSRGSPYVVMEYVEGQPLDTYCNDAALDLRARLTVFSKVLAAVQYAHGRLVVHRDLKPANILVQANGEPKLLDFGIAKLIDTDTRGLTLTGVAPMTPEYASPEQVRGEPIGTASDVYALGVLLFELLTAARPYEFASTTPSDIERTICKTPPALPSAVARGAVRVDRDLDHVLLKALAKTPTERYGSCAQFADDLRRYLDGQPVLAVHAGRGYRARKFVGRHRSGVAAALAIGAVLLGAALFAFAQAREAREQARIATRERDKSARIAEFLQDMLAAPDPSQRGRGVTVAELLDVAASSLDGRLADTPDVAAAVRLTLAATYRGLGLLDPALAQAQAAQTLVAGANDAGMHARVDLELGLVLLARGTLDEAQTHFERAFATASSLPGRAMALVAAEAEDSLGVAYRARGDDANATAHYERALAAYRAMNPQEGSRVATVLNNLAVVRGSAGDVRGAIALQEEAVAMMRESHQGPHPELAKILFNLANAREIADDFDGAAKAYDEALSMQSALLGDGHADTVQTLASFAYLRVRERRFADAEALARRAYDAGRAHLPSPHPMTAYAASILGESLIGQSRYGDAEPILSFALDARRQLLPATHPLIANSESLLGVALAHGGERAQGEALMRGAVEHLRATLGPEHELTRRCAARVVAYEAERGAATSSASVR